jgi:hypothetical protein
VERLAKPRGGVVYVGDLRVERLGLRRDEGVSRARRSRSRTTWSGVPNGLEDIEERGQASYGSVSATSQQSGGTLAELLRALSPPPKRRRKRPPSCGSQMSPVEREEWVNN